MDFLKKERIEKFVGTGEKNSQGQDLWEFLAEYNPNKYQNPSSTVDILVFAYNETNGKKTVSKVLLIKRGNHPSIGCWATPGGFIEFYEDMDTSAARELQEETGIDNIEIEQLRSYGDYDRDPRTRIITTSYVALVPEGSLKAQAGDDAKDAAWFDIEDKISGRESNNGLEKEIHSLTLTSVVKNVKLNVNVDISWHSDRILQDKKYRCPEIGNVLLGADHGALILEAYHYVNKRIKETGEK